MTFVAYLHARPDTVTANGIFYVGKGTYTRARELVSKRRGAHHQNVVRKYGKENILVGMMECSDEATAFDLERGLIKCLRRMGSPLVNKSDGGEGPSGAVRTPEMRAKMSASAKARDPSTRARGHPRLVSVQTRKKLSEKLSARPREIREAAAQKLRGVPRPQDVKDRISATSKLRVVSDETKERLRAAWVRRKERMK